MFYKCFYVFDSTVTLKFFEDMPTCFKCHSQLSSVRQLCHHLRHVHLLYEPSPISCAEGGCCRTFCRYNSFYRHISTCHPQPCEEVSSPVPVTELLTSFCHSSTTNAADDNSSSICSADLVSTKTIKDHAAHFLLTLTASSSMTLSQVNFIKDSVSQLVADTVSVAKQSAAQMLNRLSVNSADAVECLTVFDKLKQPFEGVSSVYQLEKYALKLPSYIEPQQHVLGQRWEGTDSRQQQHLKDDTFVYVSVQETVQQILHWHRSWNEMLDVDGECASSDVLSSYFSGTNFKTLYSQLNNDLKVPFYPIVLQIYYDDFETCNPIGTKAGIHKLGSFYFTIMNFGRKHNSKLDNIHLLALVYRQDIVKYGMSSVLKPLVKELTRLESGFDVILEDGSVRHVVCVLGNIVADNLGLHSILGYTESFAHSYACDLCYGTVEQFQTQYFEQQFTLRNRQQYCDHCETLQRQGSTTGHIFGIKLVCALSQLKYYHPAENDTCDIMHDILEGVAPFEVKLLLNDMILKQKLLSLDDFNGMLTTFDYGTIMSSSKPSSISVARLQSSDSLGQHSHQMLVLMYVLPLILAKYVTADNLNWKLFLLLLEILELLLSPVLTRAHLSYLAELIAEHHTGFCKLYPDLRLKYKHHRMVHYPSVMLKNGPLSQMWVMRFEAKHGYFKRLAHIVCNYRNVCKTLACRNQMRQAVTWWKPTPVEHELQIGTGRETILSLHKEFLELFPLSSAHCREAFLTNSVSLCGTMYEPGYTVIIDMDENDFPVFGYIVKIIVLDRIVGFALRQWTVKGFDWKSRSYFCLLSHRKLCRQWNTLFDYHPIRAHQCSDESCAYYHIRLRHLLCSDN